MPTDFAFRLSMYLTFVLSCLCLGYAEWEYLPEGTIVSGFVIVLLVLSFIYQGKFELSLRAANQVGFAIGLVAVVWLVIQFVRKDSIIYTLPWPASLLPLVGPLMMVLVPAKLLRPKHIGDWWALHGLGLAMVALAAAMADDVGFGLLLGLYAIVGIWSLTLFYFRRSAGLLPAIHPDPNAPVPIVVTPAEFVGRVLVARTVLKQSFGWFILALLVSLPLFFVTPRSSAQRWQFTRYTLETGLGESQIDLNRTGQLRPNKDVAFQVQAFTATGEPKLDLPLGTYWRAASFQVYAEGTWRYKTLEGRRFLLDRNSMVLTVRGPRDTFPPKLHPNQFQLMIQAQAKIPYRILLNPVRWLPGEVAPVATAFGDKWSIWNQSLDGHFVPPGQPSSYSQICLPEEGQEPGLGPPMQLLAETEQAILNNDPDVPLSAYKRLTGLPRLKAYTLELMREQAQQDPRMKQALDRMSQGELQQLHSLDFEHVARAFQLHLQQSSKFSYSLTIKRADPKVDPIEDFLLTTRSGQCERFATALALMCRAVGIPAAYTIGYNGCEPGSVEGTYFIRQDQAHAWVEVFIPRPRADAPGSYSWHWLTLDPTPQQNDDGTDTALGEWLGNAKDSSISFFLDFIIGYNPERRVRTVAALKSWFWEWWWVLPLIPLAVGTLWVGKSYLTRWLTPPRPVHQVVLGTGIDWFDQFSRMLKQYSLDLPDGLTWREYLPVLQAKLNESGRPLNLSPMIEAYYQARFAKVLPTPTQLEELHQLTRDTSELLKSQLQKAVT